jgi:hypothetical protein
MAEEKFLYYIGAGASAHALPTVKPIYDGDKCLNLGMAQCLMAMANQMRKDNFYNGDELKSFLASTADDLEALARECTGFTTIDTYAKFLYLTDRKKFEKLKTTLSTYFSIEQIWNEKIDNRYLGWVTSILSQQIFPENIKIVSWNYDYQFQFAASNFREESFSINRVMRHTPPLIGYWPAVGWSGMPHVDTKDIALLHLNGLAGSYYNQEIDITTNVYLEKDQMSRNSTLYPLRKFGESCVFKFAWETGGYQNWVINLAREMVHETTIVVVIGYSFPFFNRDIDKKVFTKLKESNKLKKIYFQDPKLDGSFLKAQFDLADNIEIIHIKEVDSFYIPFEL